MAGIPLSVVAFHLCLLASSSSAVRPATTARESGGGSSRAGRTAYHFQPAKNWQNDPNGPMYYNGMYHFFYQYNPHGALWDIGNLSWGHSVSGDLVNWAALDTALDPTSPFDANGCWSGSATILPGGTPAILYTGIDASGEQVQNVAFPRNPADPLLREWDKPSYNPVIPLPADVPGDKFRDPSTAWLGRDGLWRIVVSAEVRGVASTLVYRSPDFLRWERATTAPLHASRAAGMVECPDLFPVKEESGGDDDSEGLDASASGDGVRHVLKLSVMDTLQDYYMVGRYDAAADAFVPAEPERGDDVRAWRRLDYGHVYASKSFFDLRHSRRVLWAWANESDSQADDVAKGWSGVQTFPRKLWLDEDGKQLRQWPVEEIETLRRKRVGLRRGTVLSAGGMNEIVGVAGSQADVEVEFKVPSLAEAEALDANWLLDPQKLCGEKGASVPGGVGPFGLIVLASGDLQEHTTVFFRVFRHQGRYRLLMCTDLTRSTTRAGVYKPPYGGFVDVDVEEHETIKLRTLIDHSMLESFGAEGRICITARVYPEHAETSNSHLFVFNNGTGKVEVPKLEAWELAAATVNAVGDAGLIVSQSKDERPLYHKGMYHLFFQYNPHGPLFGTGKLSWGHSVSGDLVNWAFLGTALDPTSPFDAEGCWSGSTTTLADGRPAILYTGRDANDVQVQNVAFPKNPSDPLLREWHKPSCNPVVPQPADVTRNNFRDPTTAWLGRDGLWRFAVVAEVGGVGSTVVYRSADFVHWERNAAPLHASPDVPVWECPDLFPVAERGTEGLDTSVSAGPGVRHVLKLSKAADEDYYVVGRYDDETDTFAPVDDGDHDVRNWRRIDHGHLFGSKTFFDARKKRRVLWAWVDETDSRSDDVGKDWTGIQTFPRALWLDADGKQLVQWPVEEIETLRRERVALVGAEIGSGGLHEIAGVDALQADVEVVFELPSLEDAEELDPKWLQDPQKLCAYAEKKDASSPGPGGVGPFGLVVMASGDMREQTTVFFRVFRHGGTYKVLMCADLTRSSTKEGVHKPVYAGFVDVDVEKDRSISLRTLIDHSVIESFGGGGRTCITARVYPEHVVAGGSSHLYLFNNGAHPVTVSKLEAWELGTASVNVEEDYRVATL